MTDDTGYLLDTAQPVAGERFDALSELFDAWTFRHLAGGALDLATSPLITAWGRTPRLRLRAPRDSRKPGVAPGPWRTMERSKPW